MTAIQVSGLDRFIRSTATLSQQSIHKQAISRSAIAVGGRLREEMGLELARSQGRKRVLHGNPFTCEEITVADGGGAQIVQDDRGGLAPIGKPGGIAGALGRGSKPAPGKPGGIAGALGQGEPDYERLYDRAAVDFERTLTDVWEAMFEAEF